MIELDLTREETQILVETLESYLSDLSVEIADTDLMEYREGLKVRKAAINKVLGELKEPVAA